MSILWAGGEDIGFAAMGSATVSTSAGNFRSGFARCSITMPPGDGNTQAQTYPFPGGAITTAWLSCQLLIGVNGATSTKIVALMKTGGGAIGFGLSSASQNKWSIFKYDGTTRTQLAAETSASSVSLGTLTRLDFYVLNYGVSATVTLYVNGTSVLTYTGDVTVSGTTNLDAVTFYPAPSSGGQTHNLSEIIVADSDTRAIQGLQTLALTGAGTTSGWTNNTFSNINGASFSDANPTYVNTTAVDQQYAITDPSPAIYGVAAVIQHARMAASSVATPTQVKMGYGNGAGGAFGSGAAKTVTASYSTYQQIDAVNPNTSSAFLQSEMNGLQLNLESA